MTDSGRAPSVLWASVSPPVRWDIVYGLPHGYCDSSVSLRLETLPAVSAQVGPVCQSPELTSRLAWKNEER